MKHSHNKQAKKYITGAIAAAAVMTAGAVSAEMEVGSQTVSVKAMADALHLVMDSDRSVYTKKIVNRLVKKEKVIKASEHFEDDKALVLPAAEQSPARAVGRQRGLALILQQCGQGLYLGQFRPQGELGESAPGQFAAQPQRIHEVGEPDFVHAAVLVA